MASKKTSGKSPASDANGHGATGRTATNGSSSQVTNGSTPPAQTNGGTAPRPAKIATVSHTLDAGMAERLRYFAFRERISESAVIEYALGAFFLRGDDAMLGKLLRDAGAALRRKI